MLREHGINSFTPAKEDQSDDEEEGSESEQPRIVPIGDL